VSTLARAWCSALSSAQVMEAQSLLGHGSIKCTSLVRASKTPAPLLLLLITLPSVYSMPASGCACMGRLHGCHYLRAASVYCANTTNEWLHVLVSALSGRGSGRVRQLGAGVAFQGTRFEPGARLALQIEHRTLGLLLVYNTPVKFNL
jgi:hypothetical protein